MGFPRGSVVKDLPAVLETQVPFLGWEYPVGKEIATHSSVGTPVDRGAWWAKSTGLQESVQLVPPPSPHSVCAFMCVSLFFFFPALSFLLAAIEEQHWSEWVLFIGVSVRLLLCSQDPFFSWLLTLSMGITDEGAGFEAQNLSSNGFTDKWKEGFRVLGFFNITNISKTTEAISTVWIN